MAICKSGARFDKDSYYETIVDESNEDVTVRGTKNGEPVEYSLGGGGGSTEPLICIYDFDSGHLDKTFGEIETAVLSGRPVYYKSDIFSDGAYSIAILESYTISTNDDQTCYASVAFSNATLITSTASSIEALDAEYPFYSD